MRGLTKDRIIARDPVELGWVDSYETFNELCRQLTSFGCVDAQEMTYTNPVSGTRTGLLWLRAVTVNHSPHILSFLLDITDRKQMEEKLQRQSYYWYYCQDPQGYYPYVKSFPGGWITVVPKVPPPNQ